MWTDLSMKNKSELMSLFLKQGISSLSDMRRIYDGEQDINSDSYYLGELKPAIVKPKPVPVRLTYYPVSSAYKISHSELSARNTESDIINNYKNHSKILPLKISKKADDFDYNLITNNCSDETGNFLSECFNTNFTKGITTPIGLQRKVKEYLDNNNIYYTESSNKDGSVNLDFDVPWYNYRLERDKQDEKNLINQKRTLRNINIPEDRKQSIINNSINYILERRHPDYIPKYRIYDGEQDINTYQLSLDNYSKYRDNHTFTTEDLNVKPAPINYNEIALRQRYAESTFNNEAVSPKGAVGAYGIMPKTHKWYVDETGDEGDLKDPEYNKKIRDWLIEKNLKSDIHSPMDTDSVRVGKSLVQYNYGPGNTRKKFKELESKGIDTHNSFEWLDYFPKEPVDYVNFTLRNKDVNEHKSEKSYQKAKRKLKIK